MTGRRFEQLLRCLHCESVPNNDRLTKISELLELVNSSFQTAYKPGKNLWIDESMMLRRGRLSFRQFIKSKKNKYGIKFYEFCTHDGYALNLDIYKGKVTHEVSSLSVVDSVIMRLMESYLSEGLSLFMDNYYNSVGLANRLLSFKTHTTGTLRTNRKMNPKPKIIDVQNKYGIAKKKPIEIANYNVNMHRQMYDQMILYYSSPKKSIRWYKKVIFHLLHISIWNHVKNRLFRFCT
ncbi:LOW QUALITY PROTEIN: piggyBac transposable element-derived protein 4-like [Condylostylus longicornis]|uniref:LOW QUALITY PROTEIN: piggyBac transposable element-derived protein 4-like n=1 Tax=Condylostylus longicornis TaxID=2530218 RepID=UPI00244E01EF|nr:LOW QUALITY PROTEIN: piggyBac transposable element-derived protein 4-like [Condylostylus longicornis]